MAAKKAATTTARKAATTAPPKATGKKSNRKRFEEQGMIHPRIRFNAEERDALNSLTPDEVNAVIAARNKLKSTFRKETLGFGTGMEQGHRITSDS